MGYSSKGNNMDVWFLEHFPYIDVMAEFCRIAYGNGVGVVSQQLYSVLTRLQMGLIEDKLNWTVSLS